MHISERCARVTPSATLAIDAKAKAMKAQGLDVVGFGAGEPDFDTPQAIRDAAKAALDAGCTRYTAVAGTLELRKAICEKLQRDNGLHYTPAQIVVSNGAKHALFNAFMAILDPGDEVLIPTPCWVTYPEIVKMADGVPVYVQTSPENDFKPSALQWEAAITPKTRALVVNSPNNPCGCVYSRAELEAIAQIAEAHDLVVISDEIYENLIYDGVEQISIASLSPDSFARTIVINGLSKSFAMTGWRVGYTACAEAAAKAIESFQSHATSNINSIAQEASIAALRGSQEEMHAMVKAFDARRKVIVERIRAIPCLDCRTPQGAFYVMMDIRGLFGKRYEQTVIDGSLAFADALLQAKQVAVVPGIAFEADGYCRLSYATSLANIEKGLERIAQFVAQLRD